MGKNRKPKAVASTVNNAKQKAAAEPRSGALRRTAKAREKAKKMQGKVHKRSSQLDTALMALEKTDVGSPQAREVEEAVRAALKDMLVQRKKLRKARKALRSAEAKERKAHDRAAAAAAKEARAQAPAAQNRKAPKKRPAQKRQAKARAKSSATRPRALDTLPATEAVSGVDAGAPVSAPGASAPR